jgi:hypothetical protein
VSNSEWIRVTEPHGNRAAIASAKRWRTSLSRTALIGARLSLLAGAALLVNSAVPHSSWAQTAALPQPTVALTDENDVDLLSLNLYLHQTVLSIGSAEHPLTETIRSNPDGDWPDSMTNDGNLYGFPYIGVPDSFSLTYIGGGGHCYGWGANNGSCTWVSMGGSSEPFYNTSCCLPSGGLAPVKPTGDALVLNSDGTYTFTKRDGTQVIFEMINGQVAGSTWNIAKEVIYPDGRVLTYAYATLPSGYTILTSVTRSDGLQLHFTYGTTPFQVEGPTAVTAINNAYEYCNPAAITCSLNMTWPTATFTFAPPSGTNNVNDVFTVTDSAGRVTTYSMYDYSGYGLTNTGPGYMTIGVKLPSSTGGDNITYSYCYTANCSWAPVTNDNNNYTNYVASVTRNGVNNAWNYTGSYVAGTTYTPYIVTYKSTNPAGATEQVQLYSCMLKTENSNQYCLDPLIQFINRQGETFNTEDYDMEIQDAVMPQANRTNYTWDGRGNLTAEALVPKPGSPLQQIPLSAGYDTTCSNMLTCNEPNWVKNGNQNETDYTYNSVNGEVATVKLPPDANGVRPQTNYTYAQQSAWALNSSGQYVASAPIWVRSTESYCRTSQATTDSGTGQVDCAKGTSDKVLKTYYYGPNSNSGPNNLFLRGEEITADGQNHVTCYGYDRFGNKISVTTPNAGVALTSCP